MKMSQQRDKNCVGYYNAGNIFTLGKQETH